ncbi:unnamed protein product [Cuscuta epithymum]|uniref:Retrovirus-related Pol polyprotein from transposon TNT 1-94-like beta-barrel domain-containing protein n=1 Tax=Cuscuta epithymum TaxID=186058 RepID=A0AAV0DP78_9ASTE|nr:unnamed protein product [Cuscuta epithymum]
MVETIAEPGNGQNSPPPGFISEEWKALMTVFGNSQKTTECMSGKDNHMRWIIDIGASNHVTGNLNFLFNVKEIAACTAGLPDGQSVLATKEGSIKLTSDIELDCVLYVPSLK